VNQVAIFYPVFVQVLLVVVVGMLLATARARAVKTMDRQRGNPDLAMGRVQWPDDATKRATMIFDNDVRVENDPRSEIRKFWAEMPATPRRA
jgi:carboxylesterase type B